MEGSTASASVGTEWIRCGGTSERNGVWFRLDGTGGDVIVTTCGVEGGGSGSAFDTVLSVYEGACSTLSSGGVCYKNNDLTIDGTSSSCSGLRFTSKPATQYLIHLHGFSGATGSYDLTVWFGSASTDDEEEPVNDHCESAILVSPQGPLPSLIAVEGDTTYAAHENEVTFYCGENEERSGVWYEFQGTGGTVTVTTCQGEDFSDPQDTFDTIISLYAGTCSYPAEVCLKNDDHFTSDGSSLYCSFLWYDTDPDESYLIHLHGYNGQKGEFVMWVLFDPPPSSQTSKDIFESP